MKTLRKIVSLSALIFGASAVSGIPITGSIGFTGPYTSNNPDLTLATSLAFANSGPSQIVTSGIASGSFAGVLPGTPVTMFTPLVINQPGVVLPGSAIWAVSGFSLTLTSLAETFNSSNTLNLFGKGVLSDGNPLNNSIGDYVATFNTSGVNFTFSASSSAVPEAGTTAAMLGACLLALGVFARRAAII